MAEMAYFGITVPKPPKPLDKPLMFKQKCDRKLWEGEVSQPWHRVGVRGKVISLIMVKSHNVEKIQYLNRLEINGLL